MSCNTAGTWAAQLNYNDDLSAALETRVTQITSEGNPSSRVSYLKGLTKLGDTAMGPSTEIKLANRIM